MDKKDEIIQEHSKIKLSIYEKYLEAYFSIMLSANIPFNKIFVVDVFAGQGKDKHNNEGSALVAANIIKRFDNKKNSKSIKLYLNDKDEGNYEKLQENIPAANYDFVTIDNKDANDFIKDFFSKIGAIASPHSLLFIDPFGYTQIERATYDDIFREKNLDIFIFIPIFHIYRFLKGDETDSRYNPIALFLSHFDITRESVTRVTTVEEFADKIELAIKQRSNSNFVYHYMIENKSSKHALFFVTKNILGAEKFLEAADKIKEKLTQRNLQLELPLELFLPAEEKMIDIIMKPINPLNNRDIYTLGIKNGFLSKNMNAILKKLEKEKKIIINSIQPFTRSSGGFYISYSYSKEKPKITISPNPQNNLI